MRYNLCVGDGGAAAGVAARREQIKGRQETSEPYQIQGEPGGGPGGGPGLAGAGGMTTTRGDTS